MTIRSSSVGRFYIQNENLYKSNQLTCVIFFHIQFTKIVQPEQHHACTAPVLSPLFDLDPAPFGCRWMPHDAPVRAEMPAQGARTSWLPLPWALAPLPVARCTDSSHASPKGDLVCRIYYWVFGLRRRTMFRRRCSSAPSSIVIMYHTVKKFMLRVNELW